MTNSTVQDNCKKCGCLKSHHHADPDKNNGRTCYGIACQCSEIFDSCENCNATENLTKHHVKNSRGSMTGHISILCDPCHVSVEEEYRREGKIIPYSTTTKITHNEQLKLDYMNGLLPYYSSLGKSK